jgi:hypothetical protein
VPLTVKRKFSDRVAPQKGLRVDNSKSPRHQFFSNGAPMAQWRFSRGLQGHNPLAPLSRLSPPPRSSRTAALPLGGLVDPRRRPQDRRLHPLCLAVPRWDLSGRDRLASMPMARSTSTSPSLAWAISMAALSTAPPASLMTGQFGCAAISLARLISAGQTQAAE